VRYRFLLVHAVAAATILTTPRPAPAQSSPAEAARTLYAAGGRAYAERRYADAVRSFREAHAITHRPELLYNLGIAQAAAGDAAGAVESLSLFRDAGAPGLDDRASLDRQIAAQQEAARQHAAQSGNAPVEVRVVEQRVIEPRWIRVEYRYERPLIHAVGPWVAVGLGAALAVGSVVTGVGALDAADTLRNVNNGREPWGPNGNAAHRDGPTQATLSIAFGAAAGAFVAGGVVWLLLRGPGRRVEVPVLAAIAPTAGGATLSIGGAL
jgi:hypothetical protein